MLNVLLESSAKRQRRSGGAAMSVAAHLAIIGAVVTGTAHGTLAAKPDKPTPVVLVVPVSRRVQVVDDGSRARTSTTVAPPNVVIQHVDVPTITPVGLPPIDATPHAGSDSIVIGGARSGTGIAGAADLFAGESRGGTDTWNAAELLMHIVTPAKPRYPESLRAAGVDGRVLAEFTVDSTGRVDMSTVKILSSTHELFTRSVRDALAAIRFRPAEMGGKRVAALAQMPFEFQITTR